MFDTALLCDRLFGTGNAVDLDRFYVLAHMGVDFETGEVVDPAAEAAANRDLAIYAPERVF